MDEWVNELMGEWVKELMSIETIVKSLFCIKSHLRTL